MGERVVTLTAAEVLPGREAEFRALAEELFLLIRRRGYGRDELWQDVGNPRVHYDLRTWTSAAAADEAGADAELGALGARLERTMTPAALVRLARAVPPPAAASEADAVEAALAFVRAINAHDADGLRALMTEDHCFHDAQASCVRGAEAVRGAWQVYFNWFPDYRVTIEAVFREADSVALFGRARGRFAGAKPGPASQPWEIPAAWKAVIRGGRVAEWRVYADNEPARQQMESARA